jgi:hypothetical protein
MAIEPIVQTTELQTGFLGRNFRRHPGPFHINFDDDLDVVVLMFVSPETPTVVHSVDDDEVSLLVVPDTLEVVGLQVENFRSSFMRRHPNVARAWRLSDTGLELREFGDILLALEKNQLTVAAEIVQATRDDFERSDISLSIPALV